MLSNVAIKELRKSRQTRSQPRPIIRPFEFPHANWNVNSMHVHQGWASASRSGYEHRLRRKTLHAGETERSAAADGKVVVEGRLVGWLLVERSSQDHRRWMDQAAGAPRVHVRQAEGGH